MSTVSITFRLPAGQAQALERIAYANDRTVSGEVRRALRRHIDSEETVAGGPLPPIPGQLDLDGQEVRAA